MWGLADWTASDDEETMVSLDKAIELGCNFFDTAWAYGAGKSEEILSKLLKRHPEQKIYVATKVPPMDENWPPVKGGSIDKVFPASHIREYTEKSLKNLGVERIDLQQFHVWEDDWANQEEWQRTVEDLKREGKIEGFGISVNRWEPTNCLKAIDTGLIDSIQVIYNIFDQAPEDELFPYCQEKNIAVIARVPFDEGSLTGNLTKDTTWPQGDFRNVYFGPENLGPTVDRAEKLRAELENANMAETALRFIAQHPAVSTMIPGMRKTRNVIANMACGDGVKLSEEMMEKLRKHRWDRVPTSWSC